MMKTALLFIAWLLRPVVAALASVLVHWLLVRLGAPPVVMGVFWCLLAAVGIQVLVYEVLDADESDSQPPLLPPP